MFPLACVGHTQIGTFQAFCMGKIGINAKIVEFWRPLAQYRTSYKKLTDLARMQCVRWARLVWVRCLFDPINFEVSGNNDPWTETFRKSRPMAYISIWYGLTCCGQISWKSDVGQKNRLCRNRLIPYFPPVSRSRPKFPERCHPLTCACVPNLVWIGWVCRSYCRKIFRTPQKVISAQ